MSRKNSRTSKASRQPPPPAKSESSGLRGARRTTPHGRWEIAKRVYGVIFLVVIIYVGINLLRG
jgi:hypothetical protein